MPRLRVRGLSVSCCYFQLTCCMGGVCSEQFFILLKRHALLRTRNPMIYTGRIVAYAFFITFIAALYHKARDRSNEWYVMLLNPALHMHKLSIAIQGAGSVFRSLLDICSPWLFQCGFVLHFP